ncbi:hypothetical protein IEQ34_017182 [Dendrobium chrysotoxum]|uniref:Uncharacterized protein n=1 Tax=Dendrobium chrysotoxum TaxID=161865 RepID=A0AAV7GAG2_DENCH|nr:hypothetical protein IEQ34_017182 [Dendrobium chrysotoxum]
MEENLILINYIANHGERVWNNLARSAGLKRTGKSCRLRWLNYLRPDVRRGNITPEEQLLIMELMPGGETGVVMKIIKMIIKDFR